jgi:acyl-CoA synthetase (AMP-forming)/AMP-acid ligase II
MADTVSGFPSGGSLTAMAAAWQRQREAWRQSRAHQGVNLIEAIHAGLGESRDIVIRVLAAEHEKQVTIGDLVDESSRMAAVWTECAARPGTRIALHLPDWPEAITALWAALLMRATVVPILAIYDPAEVGFILAEARVDTYVVDDRWRRQDYLDTLAAVSGAPGLERVIMVGDRVPSGCPAGPTGRKGLPRGSGTAGHP